MADQARTTGRGLSPVPVLSPVSVLHPVSVLSGHIARAALAVLLWVLAVHPAVAQGPAATPRWTAQPSAGGPQAEARPYLYLEGVPGTVLEDSVSVTNPGRGPLTLRLRGTGAYAPTGKAGSWLRLASTTVTVPARTRAEVPFAVTVPWAAPPGDLSGSVVAGGGGREVAVPVHLRVSGPTLGALGVEDVSVSGGTIHYTLVNRGNTTLVPRLSVEADGVFGTLLRRAERTLELKVAPGRRVELTEPWPDAPVLDSVTVRLRVAAAGGVRDEATVSALHAPRGPLTGGALLLAALVVVAVRHRLRRARRVPPDRHRPTGQQASSERHAAKTGAHT